MRELFHIKKFEIGQVIIIVAIAMIALIAMAALILDGAMIMSHRRTAQATADAAALAGAAYLCPNNPPDQTAARDEAEKYVVLNNAELAEEPTFPDSNTIHVETMVESPSFFARIFNQSTLSAKAVAEAMCGPLPSAKSILPVAFPCKPTLIDGVYDYSKCDLKYYDDDNKSVLENIAEGRMTMVMTSSEISEFCVPEDYLEPGCQINPSYEGDKTVICDINCDGTNDVYDQDRKGWVSLDGSSSHTDLYNWIVDGYEVEIGIGTWLGNIPGVGNSTFDAVKTIISEGRDEVVVPLINATCPEYHPENKCPALWQTGDIAIERPGEDQDYYRIVGFGNFKLTCVHSEGTDLVNVKDSPYLTSAEKDDLKKAGFNKVSRCPLYTRYIYSQYDSDFFFPTGSPDPDMLYFKAIEGYFFEGSGTGGADGEGDGGAYGISLIN